MFKFATNVADYSYKLCRKLVQLISKEIYSLICVIVQLLPASLRVKILATSSFS